MRRVLRSETLHRGSDRRPLAVMKSETSLCAPVQLPSVIKALIKNISPRAQALSDGPARKFMAPIQSSSTCSPSWRPPEEQRVFNALELVVVSLLHSDSDEEEFQLLLEQSITAEMKSDRMFNQHASRHVT